jgi:glycerol-3-phosphate dehydrogenase (NAD(P)+)
MRVGVLGLGSWGTALAVHLAQGGHPVRGWTHDPAQRGALARERENRKYLPGLPLPESLQIVDDIPSALEGAELILLAVPSFAVREIARDAAARLAGRPVVNAAKGLESTSHLLMHQVLAEELGAEHPVASLVGPSHAEEVAQNHPTAVVAASRDAEVALTVQDVFSDESLRVYTNDDLLGVELAASLKNVIALASGIAAGLGYGDNTSGALLTRGLAEMTRLGVALGARPETFFGLAGVGDLITTCTSRHSRNRRVGEAIGRGQSLEQAMAGMTMVAEGVRTTGAARDLAAATRVDMPIVDRVHAVLYEGESPREAIRVLMAREPKAERPEPRSRGAVRQGE